MIKVINIFTAIDYRKKLGSVLTGSRDLCYYLWATNLYPNPEEGGNNILLLQLNP